jgi:DNA-binding Lrp family transcriptional regulator
MTFSLDIIDRGILALLGKDSRSSGPEISMKLSEVQISLTDRAVLQRIARLQKKKIIQDYTTILHPSIHISAKEHKFNTSQVFAVDREN